MNKNWNGIILCADKQKLNNDGHIGEQKTNVEIL